MIYIAIAILTLTIIVCTALILNKISKIPEIKVIDKTVTNNKTEFVTNERITALVEATKALDRTHQNLYQSHDSCRVYEQANERYRLTQEMIEVSKKRREIATQLEELSKETLYQSETI